MSLLGGYRDKSAVDGFFFALVVVAIVVVSLIIAVSDNRRAAAQDEINALKEERALLTAEICALRIECQQGNFQRDAEFAEGGKK